jgi:hypothetical protein
MRNALAQSAIQISSFTNQNNGNISIAFTLMISVISPTEK